MNDIKDTEARVNVTHGGKNGDLGEPVMFQSTDADIKAWVTEAPSWVAELRSLSQQGQGQ